MIPQLRDYQNQGVEQIREAFKRAIKAVCYVLSTGAGKTICFAYIAWTSVMRGKKVLILVHRKELLKQTREKLQAFGIEPGMVSPDYRPNYTAQIQVAMVQTMVGRKHMYPWFDLIVTDECFVPGTMITMGDGTQRAIETVKVGDMVLAWDEETKDFEKKQVTRTFENPINSKPVFRILAVSGHEIRCTGEHPIMTKSGWTNAAHVNLNHQLLIQDPGDDFYYYSWIKEIEIIAIESDKYTETNNPRRLTEVYNLEVADLHTYVANGIVVHNCHHVAASTYLQVIQAYPDAYQLGVTATPIRTDGKGLGRNAGGIYDYMVVGPQTAELIEMGYLVEPVIHVPPSLVDLTGVRKLGGEYNARQATERVDKRSITGDAMDHYLSSAKYEPAVVFCASVAHAEHVAAEWRAMNIRAVAVDGTKRGKNKDWRTGDDDVDRALKGLADGSVHAVMSCDLISEGTDIPAISYMADLGPTMSLGKHIQKIGRTLRPAPGKDRAIIMDHVGNVGKMENGMFIANHGLPTDIREWTLDGEMRSKRDKQEKLQSVAMCGSCYGVFIARLRVCPYCNTEREIQQREIQQREGELVAITPEMKARAQYEAKQEVYSAKTLEELEALAAKRGHKKGWAKHIYNARAAKEFEREDKRPTPCEPVVIQKQFNFGS